METKGKTVKKGIGFCATGLGSNVCDIDVTEDKDKILRIRPYHFDETGDMERLNPWKIEVDGHVFEPGTKTTVTPMQIGYKKRIYSKNRILYPMKRVDWDPNGERHPETRGVSGYERISWDEALDIIAKEIHRIVDEYGVESIYAQADGHGEAKMLHGTHGCQTRLLSRIGTGNYAFQCRQADSWEGWYWGAKHIWGMDPFGNTGKQTNLAKDVAENADALLFWGCDPETTPRGWGGEMPSRYEFFLHDVGVKQIHIAPDVNYANAVHADKWIPVLPNTDAALQLAIAYVWLTEGTYDEEYLRTHAIGFENWAFYVMGGEEIPNVGGAYRGREDIWRENQIPKTMVPQGLRGDHIQWRSHLACGLPRDDQFTGPFEYPLPTSKAGVKMIWSDAPCWTTCWNGGNTFQDAVRNPDIEFYMIQHIWMENDCNFADLLLPVTTKFEDTDISTDDENGAYCGGHARCMRSASRWDRVCVCCDEGRFHEL